eukprot:1377533-Rhodomonas_salina.3
MRVCASCVTCRSTGNDHGSSRPRLPGPRRVRSARESAPAPLAPPSQRRNARCLGACACGCHDVDSCHQPRGNESRGARMQRAVVRVVRAVEKRGRGAGGRGKRGAGRMVQARLERACPATSTGDRGSVDHARVHGPRGVAAGGVGGLGSARGHGGAVRVSEPGAALRGPLSAVVRAAPSGGTGPAAQPRGRAERAHNAHISGAGGGEGAVLCAREQARQPRPRAPLPFWHFGDGGADAASLRVPGTGAADDGNVATERAGLTMRSVA